LRFFRIISFNVFLSVLKCYLSLSFSSKSDTINPPSRQRIRTSSSQLFRVEARTCVCTRRRPSRCRRRSSVSTEWSAGM